MAAELSILVKVGASIGGTVSALRSLVGGVNGVRHSVQILRNEQLRLGDSIRQSTGVGRTELARLQRQYDGLGRSITRLNRNRLRQNAIEAQLTNLRNSREQMKTEVMGAVAAAGIPLVPIKMAMDFESSMADVRKVVDFDTPQQFKEMQQDILQLTHRIPMAGKELAAIAASGGQLGVARQDLAAFTETVAKMSVAFDMSADEAGDSMAKLANVYQIPIAQIDRLGDAINHLSNSSPAKASDIVNTLGRIGGVAKQFGLTEQQAASLSNAFISLGKRPEVAGTAINGMLVRLMTADKQGSRFQNTLKSMGMSAAQLKREIAENGEQALVNFIKRINALPKEQQMSALVDLFGREYADDIAVLAGSVDTYERSIRQLQETGKNGQANYLGSMDKEFQSRMSTTAAQWQTFKNQLMHLGITIGSVVLPKINELLAEVKPLIDNLIRYSQAHPELIQNIYKVVALLVGFKAGSLLARFGLNLLGTAFWGTAGHLFSFIGGLMRLKSAMMLFRMGRGVMALRTLGFSARQARATMRLLGGSFRLVRAVGGTAFRLLGSIGSAAFRLIINLGTGLIRFLPMVGQAFMALGRFLLTTPIGIALGLMAVAAYMLYTRWNDIVGGAKLLWTDLSNFFSSLWQQIVGFFNSGIGNISATIINWSPLGLFYQAFSAVMSWFGIELPAKFTEFGSNIIQGLWNGLIAKFEAVKAWFAEKAAWFKNAFAQSNQIRSPSRVFRRFGGWMMEGLQIGINQAAPRPLAAIGSVSRGLQQRFSDNTSSLAASMAANSAELSAARQGTAAAGGITVHFSPTINAPGGDAGQIQAAMQMGYREFEQTFRRMMEDWDRRSYVRNAG
ncbi:phage tail tape measure protein [Eikenella sp. NML99-0057]|uniref:Phage tail tape measure protein n=2 Tax=Neisseriaceae TaxID=481 RepID=A0AAX1F5U3_9NEIS|nr:phage tail tape measure protein [Eikenella sp. NML99-0057]QED91390.1 phage tail tape measure protein [Eikenella exigua]